MNILTFDLEEWYIYQLYPKGGKDYYLPLLDRYLNEVLDMLSQQQLNATFFCLGMVAKEYPDVIKKIARQGHEIGCHSDQHQWVTALTPELFYRDTKNAIDALENIIGKKVQGYRAPAFSIGRSTQWALPILKEVGIEYDCSIFPTNRDFGGFPGFQENSPCIISYNNKAIKEFPISTHSVLGKQIAYSGGGYLRLLPYAFIRSFMLKEPYVMSYCHIRDFDAEQKRMLNLRYFKNYYGIQHAFMKLSRLIHDFEFMSVEAANRTIDWAAVPIVQL
ncbi:polysaccharide deacetylase family protein [Microbacter margulisiae]|uniref:Polysaccharide deacetylase family protein (PEP-CTERM system associated) n=1 Tax=Microbacter margulisiae TaxID=1350067 RepID=A0A7W5DN39_9PORP|nr:polysaccharide deacetylase family protein [Microbacter margulisiae]MBB3185969.1 polysaccharide deacetylase family protein (PEP-CTERM system associated) [Microbacter margulisiae]